MNPDSNHLKRLVDVQHENYLKKMMQQKRFIITMQIVLLVLFFTLWELLARIGVIDSFITSQPSRVLHTILSLYQQNVLFMHIGYTLLETIVGFVLGTFLGTITAIILWWVPTLNKILEPYLIVLNSLPKIALGPIIIIWAGAGSSAIITMAVLISYVITTLNMLNGFIATNPNLIKLVTTFNATRSQIFAKVVFPPSIPTLISTLKINVGMSWVGVIAGEFLVSKAGLGYLIVYGGQVFKLDLVMTSVLILAVAAAMMYLGIAKFERYYLKKRDL